MIFGLGVVLYSCFIDLPPVQSRPAFASWSTLPLYFGIAVYAFEAIGVVSWNKLSELMLDNIIYVCLF